MSRGQQRGPAVVDAIQAEAVRRANLDLYTKPHEDRRPPAFDWSATYAACTGCSRKSSAVGSDGLCPACREPAPQPKKPAPRRPTSQPRRRTVLDRQQVVELYGSGLSLAEVAKALECGTGTLCHFMRDEQIATRAPGRLGRLSVQIDRAEVAALYAGGMLLTDLAAHVGCSLETLRRFMDREGITRDRPQRRSTAVVDERAVVAAYQAGAFVADLAREHGCGVKTIRRLLDRHGVQRRDERGLRSGGRPRTYDEAIVVEVRRLYVDEHLSQPQVAERLGVGRKVVQSIMERHEIERRRGQGGVGDGSIGLKRRMADLSITSAMVRAWARDTGREVTARGLPSAALVEQYIEAHA